MIEKPLGPPSMAGRLGPQPWHRPQDRPQEVRSFSTLMISYCSCTCCSDFLLPASEEWEKVLFSQPCVCSRLGGEPTLPDRGRVGAGTTIPGQGEVPHPRSVWGVYPHPSLGWRGVPPSQVRGTPIQFLDGRGYPHPSSGQGGTPGYHLPCPGQVPGQEGGGVPLTGIAQHVLSTRQAVCLLRSRKRTFLFSI